jgi:electron transfer flavoprotein alpha subunit
MTVLVIAEHDNKSLALATLATLTAAKEFKDPIHLLIIGHECDNVADEASEYDGLEKVCLIEDPSLENPVAERMTESIVSMGKNYNVILAPSTTFGKNLVPRIAALMGLADISDVIKIQDSKTFVRPIYAGNALATVTTNDPIKVLTVRPTAFDKAQKGAKKVSIESLPFQSPPSPVATFVKLEQSKSERPELTSASIIVSGGRGLQNKENFRLIEELADKLGAAIGASRAAVDAGFVPNDYQVGQTGKVVAPSLYIAVGISGAIQHLAGMKESKVIVAINKDPDAPIFQVADYGLVGDLFQLVPELIEKL